MRSPRFTATLRRFIFVPSAISSITKTKSQVGSKGAPLKISQSWTSVFAAITATTKTSYSAESATLHCACPAKYTEIMPKGLWSTTSYTRFPTTTPVLLKKLTKWILTSTEENINWNNYCVIWTIRSTQSTKRHPNCN